MSKDQLGKLWLGMSVWFLLGGAALIAWDKTTKENS